MSSIFGSATAQAQPPGTGLFSNLNKPNTAPGGAQTGSSLFSNAAAGNNNNSQAAGSSLFGNNANNTAQPATNSLFGNNNANANASQPAGNSLFGSNPANNAQPAGNSLFGSTMANANAGQPMGGSLFGGGNTSNTMQQQQQQQQQSSLFSNNASSTNRPTMNDRTYSNTASALQSGLGTSHFGALGQASQTELAKSRLSQINFDTRPNEKSIPERIQSLIRKWDPNSQETLLQDYTYNAVNTAYAPFYYKNTDETEREWEEALARKPANIETKDGDSVSFIPVLVRGFRALGERAEVQARTVNEMRLRLHEMNNSLTAVMTKHQQNLSVQLENARRQHIVLSQRCLRLAVKVQILRNRGYALDSAEEGLRKTLQALEKQVFDPGFNGREEEIWARMVALRERTRWLEEEGQKLGQQVDEQQRKGVPEEVVNKAKKILRDYDGQLVHLGRELEDVKREFSEWEDSRKGSKR